MLMFGATRQSTGKTSATAIAATTIGTLRPSATRTGAIKRLGLSVLLLCCAAAAQSSIPDPVTNSSLPVRTLRGYLMIAAVTINDRGPFDFLIDTGTNTTLLDPQLAAELALQPKDRLRLASLSSSTGVPRYFLQKLTLGPATLSNLEALAVPLKQLRALDPNIRGILGMNFLLHFSFRLDLDHSSVEIYPFPETARIPDGLRIPVQINESRLLIAVASAAAPHGSWKLALDSGISQLLVFQDRIVPQPENPKTSPQPKRVMQVATNLAQQSANTRRLQDVSISAVPLLDQEVVVLRNELLKPSDPQDGLLPASLFHSVFFDRFTATLIVSLPPEPVAMADLKDQ
jgi:hypothetical protein